MIDITTWGKYYNPRTKMLTFMQYTMRKEDIDKVLDLSEEILYSSLDLSNIDHITHTFWLNMMNRKKRLGYTPNRWTYNRIGECFYSTITKVENLLNKNRFAKISNLLNRSVTFRNFHLRTEEKPFAVFALALVIWYFPYYLKKAEKKLYSNFSLEELYNFVTGDNSLRGIYVNDDDLYLALRF